MTKIQNQKKDELVELFLKLRSCFLRESYVVVPSRCSRPLAAVDSLAMDALLEDL